MSKARSGSLDVTRAVSVNGTPSPIGAALPRARARRLLEGRGRYTDDAAFPRLVHAAFLRSPHPFARIGAIDTRAAAAMPGVVRVATGAEIAARCQPFAGLHALFPGMQAPLQWPLAVDRACWQGEPVVVIAAHSRAQAEDALERVVVDWEPLMAAGPVTTAALAGVAPIHPELGTNVAYDTRVSHGTSADPADTVTVRATFRFARHTGVPLETRTIVADWDPATPALVVTQSHQCPAQQQVLYARLLGLADHAVRVVCPDVGGAFGIKQQLYGDELAVCVLALMLGRPVKFVADRMESLACDIHARDHVVEAALGIDPNGRVRSMEVDDLFGIGAYSQYPRSSVGEGSHVLRLSGAPYMLARYAGRLRMVLQNKGLVGHYRAVGHPIAITVTEALVDEAARRVGCDPIEARRRSYVPDHAFPHTSHGGFTFESLSLVACHDRLVAMMDVPAVRARQRAASDGTVRVGIGVAAFVELTGTGPAYYGAGGAPVSAQDGCVVRLEPSGRVRCVPSVTDQGQGTDQAIAQVVAATLGVPVEAVVVSSGDTETMPHGGGAWASRGASTGAEAAWRAARALRENVLAVAAHLLAVPAATLDLRDAAIVDLADGRPRIPLAEVAYTGTFRQDCLPAGFQPELMVVRHFAPAGRPFLVTNGIQGALVEVDVESGVVRLRRHYVVHDSGTVLNQLLLDEQIRGGVVQGLGAALLEEIAYGPQGELLTGTLADYLVPMAAEMPDIEVAHIATPDPGTTLGGKGAGEAGTAGAAAAVLNAVNDALAPLGAFLTELPITPERVLRALGRVP